MRVLLLSRHSRKGASSRLRTLQYIPHLERQGIQVHVAALFDEAYLDCLYQNDRRETGHVIQRYLSRLSDLLLSARYDLIWLEQEVFPWLPATIERLFHRLQLPLTVDYDDAIFHRYDLHPTRLVRQLMGRKIDRVMQSAAAVIVGNRYLASRAHSAGARRVEVIPTVVDLSRYAVASPSNTGPFRIGWIGSPTTCGYLRSLTPVLIDLMRRYAIRITVIGAKHSLGDLPFDFYPWSEATEVPLLRAIDVGIMPLPDTPWTRGKCGYKLIQYMACGLPVVASKVGANVDIVDDGKNGFLVTSLRQWYTSIEQLFLRPDLCRRMGRSGRQSVEAHYHLGITAPRLADCFLDIVAGRR